MILVMFHPIQVDAVALCTSEYLVPDGAGAVFQVIPVSVQELLLTSLKLSVLFQAMLPRDTTYENSCARAIVSICICSISNICICNWNIFCSNSQCIIP